MHFYGFLKLGHNDYCKNITLWRLHFWTCNDCITLGITNNSTFTQNLVFKKFIKFENLITIDTAKKIVKILKMLKLYQRKKIIFFNTIFIVFLFYWHALNEKKIKIKSSTEFWGMCKKTFSGKLRFRLIMVSDGFM